MERSFIEENARERRRLLDLVERLTDEQLNRRLDNGWSVAVVLAHLAFWDQRSLVLMRKWKESGVVEAAPIDFDVINDALLPLWNALAPHTAAELAVSCAEAVDRELENTPDQMIAWMERIEGKYRVYRSLHRKMHLDEVEAVLGRPAGR